MTVLTRLDGWTRSGAISTAQYDAIAPLVRKDRFSVFVELNAALYLGVVALATGVAWTISTYSARFGDVAILVGLMSLFGWTLRYCFVRSLPYSHRQVETPGMAFDYVLYLGCLTFAIALGYLQGRIYPSQLDWDHSLLVASGVFFALAYRFDNRLVLSLALSTLGGWFGIRSAHYGMWLSAPAHAYALAYGGIVAVAGARLYAAGIKPHFLEAYLHIAANVLFFALVSGATGSSREWLVYLLALFGLAGLAIVQGVQFRRFSFVVYGVVYAYAGVSLRVIGELRSFTSMLLYLVISGPMVVVALVVLARRFGRDA